MGMNELGPRRCPFTFVSAILEEALSKKENRTTTWSLRTLRRMGERESPRRRGDNLGVKYP